MALRRQLASTFARRSGAPSPRLRNYAVGARLISTTNTPSSLAVPSLNTSFPYRWLRDSCQCPQCVHPTTLQKLHRSSDISDDVVPQGDGVRIGEDGVQVQWAGGHRSFYPTSFLAAHSSPAKLAQFHKDAKRQSWDAQAIASSPTLTLAYESLQSDRGLLDAMTQLSRYGLLFLTGVPNQETSDEGCEVRKLAAKFGPLRTTFYGETWDVKNLVNSRNIANTNLYLGLHMDILYFEHPPPFQILHCVRNRVKGGNSLFVDALNVAEKLRRDHPNDFDILTSTPVSFHYINDGHHFHFDHPTIELSQFVDPTTGLRPVNYVSYSPPFQAPLSPRTPPEFYPALQRFASLLDAPEVTLEYTLKEGDVVLFDNRRVLHARTAFFDPEEFLDSEGREQTNRWLKGCYFEADDLGDRGRILRTKLGL